MTDLTIEVLKQIRDGVADLAERVEHLDVHLGERIDNVERGLGQRLDRVEARLGQLDQGLNDLGQLMRQIAQA